MVLSCFPVDFQSTTLFSFSSPAPRSPLWEDCPPHISCSLLTKHFCESIMHHSQSCQNVWLPHKWHTNLQSLRVIPSINVLLPISGKNQPSCHIWVSNIHPPYQLACHCPLRIQFNHLWWKCSWDTLEWNWTYPKLHSQCLRQFQCVLKTCLCESFLNIQHFSNTGTTYIVGTLTASWVIYQPVQSLTLPPWHFFYYTYSSHVFFFFLTEV